MLELVRIEENVLDQTAPNFSRTFTLTFLDEQLPEQIWPILEKELTNYNGQTNGVNIKSEGIKLKSKNYINLFINYPKINNLLTNEEIDDSLEELKVKFQDYYENLLERIQLIPSFVE